jgi:hypothetical protein
MHVNNLWLEKPYPIDLDMMHRVLSLPMTGEDPTVTIKEKELAHEEFYAWFGTHKGKCEVVIPEINDLTIRFTMKLFIWKIIQKC